MFSPVLMTAGGTGATVWFARLKSPFAQVVTVYCRPKYKIVSGVFNQGRFNFNDLGITCNSSFTQVTLDSLYILKVIWISFRQLIEIQRFKLIFNVVYLSLVSFSNGI
jgi:hypothetical protein